MNTQNNNNTKKPFILKKKINNKYNIIPFSVIDNTLGAVKHSPSSTKEWNNSIYSYNKNYIKNLSIADKNLSKIIKSYFNFYLKKKNFFLNNSFFNLNYKSKVSIRFKRLGTYKIFVGKAELKHTSSKIFLTLYVYNQQRLDLLNKIKIIENLLFPFNNKNNFVKKNLVLSLYDKLKIINSNNNNILINNLKIKIDLLVLDIIKSQLSIISILKSLDLKIMDDFIINRNNIILKDLVHNIINFVTNSHNEIIVEKNKMHLEKEIFSIAYYKLLLNLNKFKFEDKFLLKLKPLLNKLYNKEVEFNIINLKTLYLDSEIFTEIIASKLKNRKNKLLKVLKYSLSMVKLQMNNISENYSIFDKTKLWANNFKNIKLNYIFNKYSELFNSIISSEKEEKDVFNKVLSLLFVNSSFILKDVNNKENVKVSNSISKFVLNLLKHKKIAGVRLEAKGRLTRRFTASRSVFKIKWKGTLKNIDASYKNLSSAILRGNTKSNVQYSIIKSKTRNGSFGLKGWISGK